MAGADRRSWRSRCKPPADRDCLARLWMRKLTGLCGSSCTVLQYHGYCREGFTRYCIGRTPRQTQDNPRTNFET